MLQYQLDHMEVDRRNMEMKRTENDARNSYNDFNIIMTVSGIMIANNFAVLTAVEHGPSIHSFLFDACGSLSSFCFFYVLVRGPILIALATHLGENGPAQIDRRGSAMHRALKLFRRGAPLIFLGFALGLVMAALCFVLDVPAVRSERRLIRYGPPFWIRLAQACGWMWKAGSDIRGDVQRFVLGMGEVCDPLRFKGYAWTWWFGPFGGVADGDGAISRETLPRRLRQLVCMSGPDQGWLNLYGRKRDWEDGVDETTKSPARAVKRKDTGLQGML